LRGNKGTSPSDVDNLLLDSSETLVADVWNIFMIKEGQLANQKLLQFKITNNSGDISTIETAFMRLV
jgi:beta-phosphoglucomutase-like phosphatase (HAD superfamily)